MEKVQPNHPDIEPDSPTPSRRIYQLIAALAGNLLLAGMFFKALIFPAENAEFIVRTSALMFVIEFLTIHSTFLLFWLTGFFGGIARIITSLVFMVNKRGKVKNLKEIEEGTTRYEQAFAPFARVIKFGFLTLPFIFYAVFAYRWGAQLGDLGLPAYFAASLASKYFGKKASGRDSLSGLFTGWFFFSFFIPAMTACFWERVFPFPEEIYRLYGNSWSVSGSGPCLGAPQHWAVWGLLYYGLVGVTEVALFFRKKKLPQSDI